MKKIKVNKFQKKIENKGLISLLIMLAACSFTACSKSDSPNLSSGIIGQFDEKKPKEGNENIIDSYYRGQDSRAFKMLQKNIFQKLLIQWIPKNIVNPVYNYETFTNYYVLDDKLKNVNKDRDLYYCTFTADNNKFGYVVVEYDGDSLSYIEVAETSYLYDLQRNIDKIQKELKEIDIDLSSAEVSRVKINKPNNSYEAILFRDGNFNHVFYLKEN